MRLRAMMVGAMFLLGPLLAHPAAACGFGEAPGDCGGSPESEAKYMLGRVAAALKADKAKALEEFRRGDDGFRTVDNYVFCVGPDGVMTAHPSAMLQGQDVHDLHDKNGTYFIQTMMAQAKPGQIATIRYLFPRPGGTEAVPKTTYYTRAGDQVCGVGVYTGDEGASAAADQGGKPNLVQLRQRLAAGMPAALAADWAAFTQALDADAKAKADAFARVDAQVKAADAAFGITP